jgi:hypothetical protein
MATTRAVSRFGWPSVILACRTRPGGPGHGEPMAGHAFVDDVVPEVWRGSKARPESPPADAPKRWCSTVGGTDAFDRRPRLRPPVSDPSEYTFRALALSPKIPSPQRVLNWHCVCPVPRVSGLGPRVGPACRVDQRKDALKNVILGSLATLVFVA